MAQGLFISLDGVDGSGKSTQCRLLSDWLRSRGLAVTACHDPGGTEIGDVLRRLLLEHRGHMTLECEALLFMASRAQLVSEVIRPALARGDIVVADRFLLANVVYQGYAGGLDVQQLYTVGALATGGLFPDAVFVLDLPVETALERRDRPSDRIESRERGFHERVAAGFRTEVVRHPEIRLIDADRPVEAVQEAIRREVERLLQPLTPCPSPPRGEGMH
jgi:dTMP kinase